MNFVQIQSAPWDKIYNLQTELDLKLYDKVVFKAEAGVDVGKIIEVSTTPYPEDSLEPKSEVLRLANIDDLNKEIVYEEQKKEALLFCADLIKTNELDMKLVDVRWSLDGNRITFAFVAEGRIDFRQLVKDLSRRFNRNIRLQQIGVRDEAKMCGDCGKCGRGLCCANHLAKLPAVNSELADLQCSGARNSDRLSGSCGRLMCCLSYEAEGYKHLAGKMPAVGTKVNVDGQKGVVVGHHLIKESVDVKFTGEKGENDYILEVDLNRNKKGK